MKGWADLSTAQRRGIVGVLRGMARLTEGDSHAVADAAADAAEGLTDEEVAEGLAAAAVLLEAFPNTSVAWSCP